VHFPIFDAVTMYSGGLLMILYLFGPVLGFEDVWSQEHKCGTFYLKCSIRGTERCLEYRRRWDGTNDCDHGEDEVCESETGFKCQTWDYTWCFPNSAKCNGWDDCNDHSDEHGCTEIKCQANEFKCMVRGRERCLNTAYYRCDSFLKCDDGADEMDCGEINCTKVTDYKHPVHCINNGFQKCIKAEYFCDGHVDCSDGTDENDQCIRKRDGEKKRVDAQATQAGTRKRLIQLLRSLANRH